MRRPGRAALIAGAVIGAMLIAAGCGSSTAAPKHSAPSSARASGARAEVQALLAGIAQHGNTLGDPTAPVTLDYFGDLQCPFCRQFTLGALATLISRYVRAGTLKIEYRSLESATRSPQTFRTQQTAALAAGRQNKLWNFIELFYREQGREDSGYVTESFLQGLAQQVSGLNLPDWSAARGDPELAGLVTDDERLAIRAGFRATPAFVFETAAGNLQRFQPRTLTDVTPYRLAIEQLVRLDHRRSAGAPPVSSS